MIAAAVIGAAGCPRPEPVVFLPGGPVAEGEGEGEREPTGDKPAEGKPAEGKPAEDKPLERGPARRELATGGAPMSLAIAGGQLLWTDLAGGIWTMPADGSGAAKQLSDQRTPSFAFQLFIAGGEVMATTRTDLLRVRLPDGPVKLAKVQGLLDDPLAVAADGAYVYVTMFRRPEIMRVPVAGGPAKKLADLPRAVLALRGDTLYAASYATGAVVAIATATGASRAVAKGLGKPTSIAVDDQHVYAYCEEDETLRRVHLETGESKVLARGLVNSDDVVLDGAYVYTRTWGAKPALIRVAKDGSRPSEVLAELPSPTDIVIDAGGVYVASRDGHRILRLEKSALGR